MDELTCRYYEEHGLEVGLQYASIESPFRRWFPISFLPGSRILDLGAGVGRDLAALLEEGYDACGIEPSTALRTLALTRYPSLASRVQPGSLPDDLPSVEELGGPFDGALCSAVLQHLRRAALFGAVFAIKSLLRERSRLLLSIPLQRHDLVGTRDSHGRLFNGVTADELELLFERAGFQSITRAVNDDSLIPGHSWVTLLLELRATSAARPIDHLEAVLSTRERKTATYKLALIRALCDIALTEPRTVTFTGDGLVRVPIRAIAERWITYYWPLYTAEPFLPQMTGEWKATGHRLAFSAELEYLIADYQHGGGLSAFATDRRGKQLTPLRHRLHEQLVAKLEHTIRAGPVTYAGGSLPERMFGYDRRQVLVAAPLWRELSLLGHWIQEALLLRWAELVSHLSSGEVTPDEVISRLLIRPSEDRETAAARELYGHQSPLECVWTGRPVSPGQLEVDHVLPYSLWHNNDLWNLLPAHAQVNRQKADMLPTRHLLQARRPAILTNWELAYSCYPRRFESEARSQIGGARVDLNLLFEALVESVETTALQRACPRWAPAG